MSNDQPVDFTPTVQVIETQPAYEGIESLFPVQYEIYGRDERSPYLLRQRASSTSDGSLSLRALNTERHLRHLASGQPSIPFSRFVSNPKSHGDGSSGSLFKQEQGTEQRVEGDRRK